MRVNSNDFSEKNIKRKTNGRNNDTFWVAAIVIDF